MSAPIAWSLAGSDSGGGAGIQADLKTFHSLGVHGCTLLTGLTAQNTCAVTAVAYPSLDMIAAQFEALSADLRPAAIKSGMLGTAEIMALVADRLSHLNVPYICDPVMVATSGGVLMEPSALTVLKKRLLPLASLITPNLMETQTLTGLPVSSDDEIERAAQILLEMGACAVYIKGGHGSGIFSQDYFASYSERFWLTNYRLPSGNTHGSGCTLSAAITACLALGYELRDALVIAKAYISQGIRLASNPGKGQGPVHQGPWPTWESDLPWLTDTAEAGRCRPEFPAIADGPLGFYPIFERAHWLERLLPLGIRTVQLRVKDLQGEALRDELERGVCLAKQMGARLFINDHWQLAIELGAFGVHLGQEDLATADLSAIAQSGLRLGVSTHCYGEIARALAIRPSYLAIGPIYATTAKPMRFGPRGLENLARWRKTLASYPIVAIGGISLNRIEEVRATGVDAVAVISAITNATNPESAVREALAHF